MRLKEIIGAVPFSAPVVKFFRRALQRHSNREDGPMSGQMQINSREGSREAAMAKAWAAYLLNPQDRASKLQLAQLIRQFPFIIDTDKKSALLQLLRDQEIDPDYISLAGWFLILKEGTWVAATKNEQWDVLAAYLDDDELGLSLLRETPVYLRKVEYYLSNLRRWLLVSKQFERYQKLLDAFAIQTTLNGGAWPFDEAERALLDQASELQILAAYSPIRDTELKSRGDVADAVMRTVTEGYENWPYPAWQRIMVPNERRLSDWIRILDPDGPDFLSIDPKILIAGCGTGRQAAQVALSYPDATITAIDMSEGSLSYARQQCAALGIHNVSFLNLDLLNVLELNERFDAIFCSGVLHHLPDPERGWTALADVLRPGGLMRIAVYSKIARDATGFTDELARIRSLEPGPVNDDMVRRVRRYLMDQQDSAIARSLVNSLDFGTLSGTRDLLLNPQVDPFDFPRIKRMLDHLGLRLLSFSLPIPDVRARYDQMFPHDPMHRDIESLSKFEENEPGTFKAMYSFWCRSSPAPDRTPKGL